MFRPHVRFAPLLLAAVACPAAEAQAPPPPAGPNRLVVWRETVLVSIDPDGKDEKVVLTVPAGRDMLMRCWPLVVSPDGRRVAGEMHRVEPRTFRDFFRLCVHEIGNAKNAELDEVGTASAVAWSADGTQLAFAPHVDEEDAQRPKPVAFIYTLATKARERVNLPPNHCPLDWSRDGRRFVTWVDIPLPNDEWSSDLWLVNRDGTPGKRLVAGNYSGGPARLSPDGTRVLTHVTRRPPAETPEQKADRVKRRLPRPEARAEWSVVDVTTAAVAPVRDVPPTANVMNFCWSPDGARLAYVWNDYPGDTTISRLTVCGADGANPRTVLTATGKGRRIVLGGVDWR
jgi:dipeptidyl aminopeptidase/acylaminoacyl peptidase